MVKVLLIQPPIQDFYRTAFREYPLGLLYLAASLEREGLDVSLLDARLCKKPKKIATPKIFEYLKNYYTRENSIFLDYKHFGVDFEEIGRLTKKTGPDIVVVSAMFTPYINEIVQTCQGIRALVPGTKIIVGGHHATADPDSLLGKNTVDSIVAGEGEQILPKIIGEGVGKKLYREEDGQPFQIKNLDQLPLPARHLIDPKKYQYNKRPYTMIETSRGCPHDCPFCSIHALHGNGWRVRQIDNVLAEVEQCVMRHEIRALDFQDDNLLFDRERVLIMLESLVSRYEGFSLELLASNGLNIAHLDHEVLLMMKRAGFKKLDLSLVTGNVAGRSFLNRPENVDQYETVLGLANKVGLPTTTYIILGLPTQPLSEIQQTIEYLKTKKTLISPSVFYNVPGMPIYNKMKQYEYVDDHVARRGSAFNCFGVDFDRNDIFELFKGIRDYNLKSLT